MRTRYITPRLIKPRRAAEPEAVPPSPKAAPRRRAWLEPVELDTLATLLQSIAPERGEMRAKALLWADRLTSMAADTRARPARAAPGRKAAGIAVEWPDGRVVDCPDYRSAAAMVRLKPQSLAVALSRGNGRHVVTRSDPSTGNPMQLVITKHGYVRKPKNNL